ncbi:hypothetical protein D3C71_2014030 [compost metagenome]
MQTLLVDFDFRIGNRDRGQQRLGIWMDRIGVQLFALGQLDHFAQVHNGDTVADMLNHGEVMSDEQVSQSKTGLQLFEQVDDLSLD